MTIVPRAWRGPVALPMTWIALVGLLAWLPVQARAEPAGDEPKGPHQLWLEAHYDASTSPGFLGDAGEPVIALQQASGTGGPCRTVFGYLPYWERVGVENIRWDLLTHLACFSVEVNSDGTFGNLRGWPWTSIINTAHANGVKVILVATNFDPASILTLITTPAYKQAFFENIKAQMLAGNADGVNIDFENAGPWRSHINGFMADLTAYLHAEIPGCEVTFAGPAVNWGNAWDLPGLAASCDGIFIMGYAFHGSWSSTSGPNAPLTGGSINITNTVLTQYGEVTMNNPEKLILGLPYYGHHWITETSAPRSAVIKEDGFVGSTRFRNDEPNSQLHGLRWDSVSQTPWYRWQADGQWHQVWFDNAESLGLKYDLADAYGLQGVGMWALNYDGARPELWDELDARYGAGCHPAEPGPGVPDFDGDGDVDQQDFGRFQACFTGSNVPQHDPDCEPARLDGDADVDADDLALFLNCFSGSGIPFDPDCLP